MKWKIALTLLCAAICSGIAPATAQMHGEAPAVAVPWIPVDEETGKIKDLPGLKALAIAYPDSGNVRLRLLTAQYLAQDFTGMLDTLSWLKQRGYVFGETSQLQIPKLIGEQYAQQARELMIPAPKVVSASKVVATYTAEAGLLESVIRFPAEVTASIHPRPVFMATSVTERVPAALFPQGSHVFFGNNYTNDNVTGIIWDSARKSLWVASGNIDGSPKDKGRFSGLVRVFHSDDPREQLAAPDGAEPSDLAVGPDGTLYTSDPVNGGIYFATLADEKLQTLIAPGTFRSPQGLAVSADGPRLYVSDYRYGIAVIELESRAVSRLASDLPLILDGVDGLWRYGNELIAVQNGTSPMRIAAFELSDDGLRVTGHRILEQANPEWTEPLSGSIDGDSLIYVGNGQWDRYVQGESVPDKPALPTQIRRLPLH